MKRCLILLTSEFPYNASEPFLETEIWFHEKTFDKIIILAIDLDNNAVKTRDVPQNTDYYNVTANRKKAVERIGDVLRGALNVFSNSEYIDDEKMYIGADIRKRAFFEYINKRAEREYKYCADILDSYNLKQYDSITIYSYWFFATALIGVKIRDSLRECCSNLKVISRAHRYDLYTYANGLDYLPMRKYLLKNLDAVYPCSSNGENYLTERYPDYSSKINCKYLGTFDNGKNPNTVQKTFNVLSCSRITKVKKVSRIVEALELLEKNGMTNIKWTHIGNGKFEHDVRTLALKKLKYTKVEFAGQKANKEVNEFYRNNHIDLFVNTSTSEGIPVSIIEAMSFGIPVVATNVGGVSEIVLNDYNGWLINPDYNAKELADVMRRLDSIDKDEVEKYRNNAIASWQEKFNAEKNYAEFSKMLSEDSAFV